MRIRRKRYLAHSKRKIILCTFCIFLRKLRPVWSFFWWWRGFERATRQRRENKCLVDTYLARGRIPDVRTGTKRIVHPGKHQTPNHHRRLAQLLSEMICPSITAGDMPNCLWIWINNWTPSRSGTIPDSSLFRLPIPIPSKRDIFFLEMP